MIERRKTARRRVYLGGLVQVAAFLPDIACIVRDVSLTGIRIGLEPDTVLPACFDLRVLCRGETRHVRLVWREGAAAGLAIEEASADAAPADVLRRLAESEDEVARLRAALAAAGPAPTDRLH